MTNPRRRRTVIVTVTAIFILIFQLPNLLNMYRPWLDKETRIVAEELGSLNSQLQSGEIDSEEYAAAAAGNS